ncbi:MAG: GDP-mannose 6-dehydrogenase [Fimbriimonadales bacterium]
MRISVFGLGYVGAVSAACFARSGHTVVGVDPDENKLRPIRDGQSPIVEKDLGEYLAESVAAGRLSVTSSAKDAVTATDVSLICVGTPSRPNGSLSTEYIERVCSEIGEVLRDHDDYHRVVVRSTLVPGTFESLVIPTLERTSGKKAGEGFGVAMNPEFLREGSAIFDFHNPPFTVIGTPFERDYEMVAAIYEGVQAPVFHTRLREAEMIKYVCNWFHALKVTFTNEVGMMCKAEGVDARRVMEIFCLDTKLNISTYYMKPGFAFGGSCLPKDVKAAVYRSRQLDIPLPVLEAIMPCNKLQIERLVERIQRYGKKQIGLLGLSFKPGTDDLRESPLVTLAEHLIGKGYRLRIFDPNVSYAALFGSNKAFIEREIPHIAEILRGDADEVIREAEVLIFSHNSPEFASLAPKTRPGQLCIDLAGVGRPEDYGGTYEGLYW